MKLVLKAAVVLAPLLAIVGLLRLCEGDSGRRWLARVQEVDSALVLGVDTPQLIAIAPSEGEASAMGALALRTRDALAEEYGDLLGEGLDRRMVVVVFSETKYVAAFGGRNVRVDRRSLRDVIGLTQPARNAIYLPPGGDLSTLKHEVVHLLMGQSAPPSVRFSPWLSEGLAQYFESYQGGRHTLPAGQRAYLRAALGDREPDVPGLIRRQDYDEFLQVEGGRNYLESLALVACLLETQPRERMKEYVDLEKRSDGDRYLAFRDVFGDPQAMSRAVAEYLRR